ncbi:MAG: SUMF1/EgtB/PvdO family nonheme iron enzyme [Pelatocladus maniniholoensis HA4357-MV3]|uniref:SUMF1/EgtB/PvdO family nonheme iron enzyme n=1 Tax=Pelatocladus maniniholoensis HA4357-MV3 TaxID=1117104 RepID=A0A9E3LUM6_9NOST|nr:SUMF1/EgtB/PvdO family nonheme iron enzyme [Pelatocladus maniniholoensis HA4357-MV3]
MSTRWAFLVGVNRYVDSGISDLNFCVNDVLVLGQTLESLGYEVVTLHDQQDWNHPRFPNRNNVEARLKHVCDAVQPDDLLWVHFACHGTVVKTAANHTEPILITCDTQINLLEQQALPVAKVEQYMKASQARRFLLTLDACHTGLDIGRDLLADPEFIHNVYEQAEGFALIAASTAQQRAFEWREKQHGVFTYHLLEALSGQADRAGKNFVTVDDLKNHVLDGLRRWGVKNDILQEPTARTEGLGDMILADYRKPQSQNSLPALREFEFEVVTVRIENKGFFNPRKELISNRRVGTAKYFVEDLGQGIGLEMVEIPGGRFTMGAPIEESDSRDSERPQHRVIISTFFMGKYPITQAQWRAVAALPKINRDLKPDPSHFKGDNRPVECVSWYDAVEFCARLSLKTGREYRLPSEAEWEYACRAGTTTPFYFGETITTDLANYNGNYIYGDAPKGKYREETTPVGYFPPNAFGLYDMHGNVWELCADDWHDNYAGAPTDGSAWQSDNKKLVLRGGSWGNDPEDCRSACRGNSIRAERDGIGSPLGFRVVCAVGRT